MKKYLILSLYALALTFTACGGNTEKKEAPATAVEASSAKAVSNAPVMTFDRTIHDFGTIQEGERVKHFLHSPILEVRLVIVDARGSCGCTVPEYPKNTPIAPVQQDKFALVLILATNPICNKRQLPFLPIQIQVAKLSV